VTSIFLTGGTGFVGSHVARALAPNPIRVLVRSPKSRTGEGIEPVVGDVTDPSSLTGAIDDCDVVVHLVGIIEEAKGVTFDGVIRQGTEHIVTEAKRAGVRHFVHMSALGARDDPRLPYMQAKYRSEEIVKASGLPYTIFRPSVIFGPGDGFINALAGVVRKFPIVPVVGDGRTPFQPVAVSDVATAFAAAVNNPDLARNQTIELGGVDELTYEEMIDLIAQELEKKKPKVHVPVSLMKLVVAASASLPRALRPPVTPEQLKMLSLDNRTDPAPLERLIGHEPLSLRGNIGYIRSSQGQGGGGKFTP
jgi:NADH dehydrogenase